MGFYVHTLKLRNDRERNRQTNPLRVTHWWDVIGGEMETGEGGDEIDRQQ